MRIEILISTITVSPLLTFPTRSPIPGCLGRVRLQGHAQISSLDMSEYSIPISRETSPARGKRKKLSTACDACQKRKSRCEMVTSKGCHRCRTLGTICSRAGGEEARRDPHADGFTGRSRSPSAVQASSSALEDLQTRTRRMEGMLSVLLRQSGAAHAPASHTILPGRTVLSSEEVVGPNNQSSVGLANRALNLRRMSYMRDPIALGLISDERWQMVYSEYINQAVPEVHSYVAS